MFDELIHDGTDWLLKRETMFPPKSKENDSQRMTETLPSDHNEEDRWTTLKSSEVQNLQDLVRKWLQSR
jgi:hypothetical protein